MDYERFIEIRRSKIRAKLLKAAGCDAKSAYYLVVAGELLLRVSKPERKNLMEQLEADPSIKQQFTKMLRLCDV